MEQPSKKKTVNLIDAFDVADDDCGETIAKLGDFGLHTCVAPSRPGSMRCSARVDILGNQQHV